MRRSCRALRRVGLLVWVFSFSLLLGSAAQDDTPINGYGPWAFGMRHFQVASFKEFGPYVPVEHTGGLETRNGTFEDGKANISFVFGSDGLEYVQIWAYEGSDVREMMRALHRVYDHLSERYGDLMIGPEKLGPGLSVEQLADSVPEEYMQTLTSVSEEELRRRGNIEPQVKQLQIEPIWHPTGARVVVHLNRIDDVGTTYVMLFYSRAGEPAAAQPEGVIDATTKPAEVIDTTGYYEAQMIGADEYTRRAGDSALLAQHPDLSSNPEAHFLLMSLGPSQAVATIVGNFSNGFELLAVPPAVEEPVELRFAFDGKRFFRTVTFTAREQSATGLTTYPVVLRFVMHPDDGADKTRIYALAMRRGVAQVDGREIEFGLTGDFGIFNEWNDTLYFDLDGNGAFSRSHNSSERFSVSDGYVTIAGNGWQFDVDRLGQKISLTPLDDSYPERAALDEGAMAPDFSFVGIDGTEHRLSDYRGKIVLLDFWGAWCAPCHEEAPHLAAAHARFRDLGFEIIGINYKDAEEDRLAFMRKHGITWPQARESDSDRPIHETYRNWTWPTHYLVDEEGVIIKFNPRGEELIELLEERLGR